MLAFTILAACGGMTVERTATGEASTAVPGLPAPGGGAGVADGEGSVLDPEADTDGDGFTDGDEQAYGSDPSWRYSHPYEGGYNVGLCPTPPAPTGPSGDLYGVWEYYEVGDVVDNHTYRDQYGQQVDLYAFCGRTTVLVLGGGTCGPCQTLAAQAEAEQQGHADHGLQLVEVLERGWEMGAEADDTFIGEWADTFGLVSVPVIGNLTLTGELDLVERMYVEGGGWPIVMVIGPDMEVLHIENHAGDFDVGAWVGAD